MGFYETLILAARIAQFLFSLIVLGTVGYGKWQSNSSTILQVNPNLTMQTQNRNICTPRLHVLQLTLSQFPNLRRRLVPAGSRLPDLRPTLQREAKSQIRHLGA